MFVEEAKTLVQMSHPNVVPVYELGVVDGVYFLAMEHVEGATLDEILHDGSLSPALVAHVGVQVCDALAYAHERFALVHRDVTPRNVIVDARGHTRLLDFGIAAPAEGTGTGEVFGSHGYMSPEQARGEEVDPRSDLFSLGIVLYEALTGERAFLRASPEQTLAALLESPPPRLAGCDGVPPGLAPIIDGLLAAEPNARPGSAAGVGRHLRGWLSAERPEGVAPEVGARAEVARGRRDRERRPSQRPPGARRDPSGIVRTIATSAVLEALIGPEGGGAASDEDQGGTVPLARASRAPSAALPVPSPSTEAGSSAQTTTPPVAPRGRGASPGAAWRLVPLVIALGVGAAAVLLARPWLGGGPPASSHPAAVRPEAPPHPSGASNNASSADPGSRALAARRGTSPSARQGVGAISTGRHAAGGSSTSAPHARDPVQAAPEPAWLTVNASPWAEVRVDGRSLGTTPRRRQSVPPGPHMVELRCPPLGRTARVPVHTTSGATTRVIADLTTDPPTVTVR